VGNDIEKLEEACRLLVGKCCWTLVAGSGTGSVVSLGFGAKIPLKKPLTNPNLTLEEQENDAEFGLFVECVWRLDDQTKVVCGAWDDNRSGGPMLTGLARLIGHRVAAILLRRPGLENSIPPGNSGASTFQGWTQVLKEAKDDVAECLISPLRTETVLRLVKARSFRFCCSFGTMRQPKQAARLTVRAPALLPKSPRHRKIGRSTHIIEPSVHCFAAVCQP
jgi:hypothetical protein